MPKKFAWPVCKIRDDGMPAVWLTHSAWMILREALVREYLRARENIGERRARIDSKTRDEFLDHFLGQYTTKDRLETSLALYRIGSAAYFKPEHRTEYKHLSPDDLIALGDTLEGRAYDRLLAKNSPADKAA